MISCQRVRQLSRLGSKESSYWRGMMIFKECKSGAFCSFRGLMACGSFAVCGILLVQSEGWGQVSVTPIESSSTAVSQESPTSAGTKALHDKLANYLTGTRWEGQFSMTGVKGNQTETYEIIKAEKGAKGDYWNLIARIKYGGKDATLPRFPVRPASWRSCHLPLGSFIMENFA